jgi:hypothetical protein
MTPARERLDRSTRLRLIEKLLDVGAERLGQPLQNQNRWVLDGAFQTANIDPVDSGIDGQDFLGHRPLDSQSPQISRHGDLHLHGGRACRREVYLSTHNRPTDIKPTLRFRLDTGGMDRHPDTANRSTLRPHRPLVPQAARRAEPVTQQIAYNQKTNFKDMHVIVCGVEGASAGARRQRGAFEFRGERPSYWWVALASKRESGR